MNLPIRSRDPSSNDTGTSSSLLEKREPPFTPGVFHFHLKQIWYYKNNYRGEISRFTDGGGREFGPTRPEQEMNMLPPDGATYLNDHTPPLYMTQMPDDSVEFSFSNIKWSIKDEKGDAFCKNGWYWTPSKPKVGPKPKTQDNSPSVGIHHDNYLHQDMGDVWVTTKPAVREVDCQFRYDSPLK